MDQASNLNAGQRIGTWTVISKLSRASGDGGGGFSSGYKVVNDNGQEGYLKAFNISYAMRSTGATFMDSMNELSGNYLHERDIVDYCKERDLNRVVVGLDSGEILLTGQVFPLPYLVFELSPKGSLTKHAAMAKPGLGWRLRVFHGICVGLTQLHNHDISHQDIKPDNVLIFKDDWSKLADLGRATVRKPGSRFGNPGDCGDMTYSPFELWYGYNASDWAVRRKSLDLFMLGGVLIFLVSNKNILTDVWSRLPPDLHPKRSNSGWQGTYVDILPVLRNSVYESIAETVSGLRADLQDDVEWLCKWLCEPDPNLRGHPENIAAGASNRYSLERVITVADRVASKAELSGI